MAKNINRMRHIKKFNEAVRTECQTGGAVYKIDISEDNITAVVNLPFELQLDKDEAKLLESNIHNALELVMAPYFKK